MSEIETASSLIRFSFIKLSEFVTFCTKRCILNPVFYACTVLKTPRKEKSQIIDFRFFARLSSYVQLTQAQVGLVEWETDTHLGAVGQATLLFAHQPKNARQQPPPEMDTLIRIQKTGASMMAQFARYVNETLSGQFNLTMASGIVSLHGGVNSVQGVIDVPLPKLEEDRPAETAKPELLMEMKPDGQEKKEEGAPVAGVADGPA